MKELSETDALKTIDEVLSGLELPDARNRVLSWAWDKFSSNPKPLQDDEYTRRTKPKKTSNKKTSGANIKARSKAKTSLTMVKDLNLKPKGGQSLDQFVGTKKPHSYYEKSTISAYYLKHELDLSAITINHIYTCFKHMKWRIPTDPSNSLAYTASRYGWLDTSDRQDIKVTTMGENLVEHDLPRTNGSEKK